MCDLFVICNSLGVRTRGGGTRLSLSAARALLLQFLSLRRFCDGVTFALVVDMEQGTVALDFLDGSERALIVEADGAGAKYAINLDADGTRVQASQRTLRRRFPQCIRPVVRISGNARDAVTIAHEGHAPECAPKEARV